MGELFTVGSRIPEMKKLGATKPPRRKFFDPERNVGSKDMVRNMQGKKIDFQDGSMVKWRTPGGLRGRKHSGIFRKKQTADTHRKQEQHMPPLLMKYGGMCCSCFKDCWLISWHEYHP